MPATQRRGNASIVGAEVIVLESHPAWISVRRYEAELLESMSRHPSSMARP
ncbi:hypothetical protein [Mycobacterium sp. E2989]|nr:hypothetical protein [Mycobacterium sp. E2989]